MTVVRVQALCPGFTRTDFYRRPESAGSDNRTGHPTVSAVLATTFEASMVALARNQPVCIPDLLSRVLVAAGQVGLTRPLPLHLDVRPPPSPDATS